jgi:hypothetical protein
LTSLEKPTQTRRISERYHGILINQIDLSVYLHVDELLEGALDLPPKAFYSGRMKNYIQMDAVRGFNVYDPLNWLSVGGEVFFLSTDILEHIQYPRQPHSRTGGHIEFDQINFEMNGVWLNAEIKSGMFYQMYGKLAHRPWKHPIYAQDLEDYHMWYSPQMMIVK